MKISTPYKRGLSLSEELVVEVSLAHAALGFTPLFLQAEVSSGQAPTGLTPTPSFTTSPFIMCHISRSSLADGPSPSTEGKPALQM